MIDWLVGHPYTLAFAVIAIITRKDLAIFCLLGSIGSSLMWDAYPYKSISYVAFCAINALLVLFAGFYNQEHSTMLSKAVMILCTLGCIVNGWQLIGVNNYNYSVSVALGVSLMACLLFMDGRKGMIGGLWKDLRFSFLRHVHYFSGKNNNGNSH